MYFGIGYGSAAGLHNAGVLGDGQANEAPWRLPRWQSAGAALCELVHSRNAQCGRKLCGAHRR